MFSGAWSVVLAAAAILATRDGAPIEVRYPDATEIYHCDFGEASDPNYDGWPSGWTRRAGAGYPHYVEIKLQETDSPDGNPALRIQMDGGAAAAFSPPIEISTEESVVLEAWMKVDGRVHDEAYLSLSFLDAGKNVLATLTGEHLRVTDGWRKLRLGPVAPSDGGSKLAMVGVHVVPRDGQDLSGTVWFDDVWLARLPRVELASTHPQGLFFDPAQVNLECKVSGLTDRSTQLRFELHDALGQEVDQAQVSLSDGTIPKTGVGGAARVTVNGQTYRWRPAASKYGFYRARAMLVGQHGTLHERRVTLAIIKRTPNTPFGEFGWSLPQGAWNDNVAALLDVLSQSSVNWVSLPMWYGPEDARRLEDTLWLVDQLRARGIETVGLLAHPPVELRDKLGLTSPRANDIFMSAASVWYPSLEQVMLRSALRVRWWQLGTESDQSLIGYSDLVERLAGVRGQLETIGRDTRIVIPWSWLHEQPVAAQLPWQAAILSATPALTPAELVAYLRQPTSGAKAERWITLTPLPEERYNLQQRLTDLVERMVAARLGGAERIMVPDALNPQQELWESASSPGEMLVPWRTVAGALRGGQYLGSMELPEDSHSDLFARPGGAVVVLWNPREVSEPMFFGHEAEMVDLWGNSQRLPTQDGRQFVPTGPLPRLVLGASEPLMRLQTKLKLENGEHPGTLDVPHQVLVSMTNPFDLPMAGTLTFVPPNGWRVQPERVEVALSTGESLSQPVDLTLTYDSDTVGRQLLQCNFDVTVERRYQFSVYRELTVGSGNVELDVTTHLNERKELEVELRLLNRTDRAVSFNCDLFIPGRRHQRLAITQPTRGEMSRTFRLPNGVELVGETLRLRAVEVGGRQVINRSVEVQP